MCTAIAVPISFCLREMYFCNSDSNNKSVFIRASSLFSRALLVAAVRQRKHSNRDIYYNLQNQLVCAELNCTVVVREVHIDYASQIATFRQLRSSTVGWPAILPLQVLLSEL